MSYLLVSLVGHGDPATIDSDAFAEWLAREFPPVRQFRGEAPAHDAVASAAKDVHTVLVFGHDGGGGLRASPTGPTWADAQQFAQMFIGKRVYVYACDTMGARFQEDLNSFGQQAVRGGVSLVAGHCGAATACVSSGPPTLDEAVRAALATVLRRFVEGENDARALGILAEESFDIVDVGFVEGIGVPLAIRSMMRSLRIVGSRLDET